MKKITLPMVIVLMHPFMLFAQGAQQRQVYGAWQYNQDKGYHYRKLEYKANPADKDYKHEYPIISNASCTTNCLAPFVKVRLQHQTQ